MPERGQTLTHVPQLKLCQHEGRGWWIDKTYWSSATSRHKCTLHIKNALYYKSRTVEVERWEDGCSDGLYGPHVLLMQVIHCYMKHILKWMDGVKEEVGPGLTWKNMCYSQPLLKTHTFKIPVKKEKNVACNILLFQTSEVVILVFWQNKWRRNRNLLLQLYYKFSPPIRGPLSLSRPLYFSISPSVCVCVCFEGVMAWVCVHV